MNQVVSVVVPIYNVENYLPNCLRSIARQTYPHLQVILVDDGSTDRSGEIADEFARKDARFLAIHQTNGGLSVARNTGLKHAIGHFVSFVDADDFLADDFFQTLVDAIGNADVLQFGYTRVNTSGKTLFAKMPYTKYQFVSACARFYRRVILQKNAIRFPKGQIYEDVIFSIDLWRAKPKIKQIKYAGYYYRLSPGSITSQKRDTVPIFALISEKLRLVKRSDIALRLKIRYLQLRLKLHFLFGRN